MKDEYTTNCHYLTCTALLKKVWRMYSRMDTLFQSPMGHEKLFWMAGFWNSQVRNSEVQLYCLNLGVKRLNLPIQLCRNLLIAESNASVIRSPRLAAMGVATLSGLMLHFFEQIITTTMTEPRMRLASVAVTRLLAHRRVAWWTSKCPSSTQPIPTAAMAAKAPTTVAWTCPLNDRQWLPGFGGKVL